MFSKMWCVGIFTLGIMTQGQATAHLEVQAILNTKLPLVVEVAKGLDQDKIALIEEIIALVRPHLSQEEMNKLLPLLQKLAGKVTVPTLIEIHRKLKTDIVKFGVLAFLGIRAANSPQGTLVTDDTDLAKIQCYLHQFLSKTDFTNLDTKQKMFIRTNAEELSRIISSVLKQHLPDCLHDLSKTFETLKGLEKTAELHQVITQFVEKHKMELPS